MGRPPAGADRGLDEVAELTSEIRAGVRAAPARRPGGRGWLLVTPAVVLVLAVFCLPAVLMVIRGVTEPELGTQNFAWLLGNETALAVLVRTLVVADLATLVCLLLGYPYAYLMSVAGRTGRGVLIGMCQILMPFMVLPLYAAMNAIDRRLLDAGHILGAPPGKAFWQVYVPLSLPGVFTGSLMVFVLSLGFYVTPAMLGSPRQELLPNALASEINDLLNWGHGGALAVALLVCVGAMFLLATWVSKRVTGKGASGSTRSS
ncbi:MAG: ABC transporter permease subunit [Streptosporangiales bacterium]|nr:ABC transporter permease subunit [Streptosporangiales bacterium]